MIKYLVNFKSFAILLILLIFEKKEAMTTLEIKADIFKSIDSLNRNKLYEIKGYLENLKQKKVELEDWANLSQDQKNRLKESIAQLDSGNFINHKNVMKELRDKVNNA